MQAIVRNCRNQCSDVKGEAQAASEALGPGFCVLREDADGGSPSYTVAASSIAVIVINLHMRANGNNHTTGL